MYHAKEYTSLVIGKLEPLDFEFKNFKMSSGKKLFALTNMGDPYNLILILWWRWMESTSCSLPRQHWFGEGYHSFLHFPRSILGKIFQFPPYLKVAQLQFTWIGIFFDLYDDFLLFAKIALVC